MRFLNPDCLITINQTDSQCINYMGLKGDQLKSYMSHTPNRVDMYENMIKHLFFLLHIGGWALRNILGREGTRLHAGNQMYWGLTI